ncbi:MAG: DUF2062 domain-containing protein [Rhodospirillales bacterium]
MKGEIHKQGRLAEGSARALKAGAQAGVRARAAAGVFTRLGRAAYYRLIVPIKRSQHPPEHTARGVFAGVFWAFTPLVGVQMPITLLTWFVSRKVFKRDFNLIIALAWNWVTNVFTMLPTYYVFYLTGQVMLGRWDGLADYGAFAGMWTGILHSEAALHERLLEVLGQMARTQGLPLAVGWAPFALILSPLGYFWSLKLARMRRERLATRAA